MGRSTTNLHENHQNPRYIYMYKPIRHIMKCYNCGERKMKTIYPKYKIKNTDTKYTQFVQKWCIVCNYKSYPIKVMRCD